MCVEFADNAYYHFPPFSGWVGPRGHLEKAVYESFNSNMGLDSVEDNRVFSEGGNTYQVPFLAFCVARNRADRKGSQYLDHKVIQAGVPRTRLANFLAEGVV